MSINPLKEFFKRKKAEAKFARAGPGQKLSTESTENSSTSKDQSSARQAAAEAAMKRFNKDNTKPAQRPRISAPSSSSMQPSSKAAEVEVKTTESAVVTTETQQKELPVIDGVAQRNVQVYSTEELVRRIKEPDIDDDFFRLTVEDAKLFKQRYDEERARNEILKTSEMRRREAEAKKPTTNVARLRFKLPNNLVLEASFSGNEPLNLVRDWLVSTCLDKMELDLKSFEILFGLRPFKGSDFDKSVKQLGLIPATTLTVVQKSN